MLPTPFVDPPRPPELRWIVQSGTRSWWLRERPLVVGRLPESDIVLDAAEVSRRHAYILPAREGPMLVDTSRLGTKVNDLPVVAPVTLDTGDRIQIGRWVLQVFGVPAHTLSPLQDAPASAAGRKVREWLLRYGPSELLGTVVAVGVATAVQQGSGSTVLAAYVATLAEMTVYYGLMLLRETVRDAHSAGKRGEPYGSTDVLRSGRNLVLEFGLAEAVDGGVIRPLCLGLGLRLLGGGLGVLLGKLAADLAFYGPVLAVYEWRLARRQGRAAVVQATHRRTTAAVSAPED